MSKRLFSEVDKAYRLIIGGGMFPAGWGDTDRMRLLMELHNVVSKRDKVQSLIERNPDVVIMKTDNNANAAFEIYDGCMLSPLVNQCPGLLPEASKYCKFQLILPKLFLSNDRPVAVHMAGTGDQYFWRRRKFMAEPLANEGIASVILENPFYGSRRPSNQIRSNVRFVTDIFVMGCGLVLESLTLIRWLEAQGYGPFCMTGISMGGHMASIAATSYDKPIAIAPCLSWSTASPVFTRGVMTNAINWKICEELFLNETYFSNQVFDQLVHYEDEFREEISKAVNENSNGKAASTSKGQGNQPIWCKLILYKFLDSLSECWKSLPISRRKLTNLPINSLSSLTKEKRFLSVSFSSSSNVLSKFKASLYPKTVHDYVPSKTSQSLPSRLITFYRQDDSRNRRRAIEFMRRLMDHYTHLCNYDRPVDPELAVFVSARYDAYVLKDGVKPMTEIWPGSEVEYIDAGHVIACLSHQNKFRSAIRKSIDRHRQKYNHDGSLRKSLTH